MSERQTGILCSAGAFAIWGVFPLYFKAIRRVPALQIVAHRVLWLLGFMLLVVALNRRWAALYRAIDKRTLLPSLSSAALLSINWLVYVWAVNADRVVDASLGYFVNPLVSVVLGVVVLRESLRAIEWVAIALAASGVLWLTLVLGQLPWIALALAASFGAYGLWRKTAKLGAIDGLALETALIFPIAALYLGWLTWQGQSAYASGSSRERLLLALSGPVTGVPLLLFAAGARRIPLSLLGVLQYIVPTTQFLLGVLVWHEPFSAQKFVGYALIWSALVLYTFESIRVLRSNSVRDAAGLRKPNRE